MSVGVALSVVARNPAQSAADFYTLWDSARALREGVDPYLGIPLRPGAGYNLNPPIVLLLFLPFSWLPLLPAFLLWTLISLVLYAAAGWAIARELAPRASLEIVSAIFISQATFAGIQLGQPAALLMVVLTAAWIADRRGQVTWVGVLLGAAMGTKLFLGLFVLYSIWRRSSRLLLGTIYGLAGVFSIGLIPLGIAGYRSWLVALGQVTWAAHLANASLLGFFTRELTAPPAGSGVVPLAIRPDAVPPAWYGSIAVVAVLAVFGAMRARDRNRVWLLTIVTSLCCSPLGWSYYVPVAAGPAVAVFVNGTKTTRALLAMGYGCFLVPYTLLVARPLGSVATMTLGSVYLWGLLCWLAATLTGPSDTPRNAATMSLDHEKNG